MKYSALILAGLVGLTAASPVNIDAANDLPIEGWAKGICGGLLSKPMCCTGDLLGLVHTGCVAPYPQPVDAESFINGCYEQGKAAQCCSVNLLGNSLLCNPPHAAAVVAPQEEALANKVEKRQPQFPPGVPKDPKDHDNGYYPPKHGDEKKPHYPPKHDDGKHGHKKPKHGGDDKHRDHKAPPKDGHKEPPFKGINTVKPILPFKPINTAKPVLPTKPVVTLVPPPPPPPPKQAKLTFWCDKKDPECVALKFNHCFDEAPECKDNGYCDEGDKECLADWKEKKVTYLAQYKATFASVPVAPKVPKTPKKDY